MPERRRARAKSVRPRRPRKASRTAAGWSSSGRYSQVSPGPSSTSRSQPARGAGSAAASTLVARSPTAGTRMARSRAGVAATTTRTGSSPSGSTAAVAASRSNTGPWSAMRRQTATPSRRTSPSWVVGGPSMTASIPNGRNARGDSARPSTRSGRGAHSVINVPVPDDPQAVEGEPGLVALDGLTGVQDGPGQAAGGDHGGRAAQLGHHPADDPVDLAGEAPDGPGLEALHGVLADHRPGRHQLDPAQLSGPLDQGVHGDLDAGGDGRAQVLAPLGDGVEGGGSAEVDHHHRPPVGGVGGDRVDHPVGPDLARVVGQDGQPGADPGLHDQRLHLAVAPHHLAQGLGQPGHHRGDHHPAGVTQLQPLLGQEPAQQQGMLVGGPLGDGGGPPVLGQLVALEHPDGDLGVPDVHREQHRYASQSMAMSSDGAEWVSAPTATKSTPVSATALARSRVTPPEASVRARRRHSLTASAIAPSSMLSSSSRSQPRSRASATWSRVSNSTSRGRPGPAALAASTARRRLPAARMWLSLTSRASYRPMRWLAPPPQRTAYFSRWRSPGVVLRVSRTTTPVPATASTKAAVRVATPDRCPRKLSIVRSAASSTLAGPANRPSTAPASTGALSATSGRNAAGPSRSRSRTSARTTSTAGSPATTPGPRATSSASARAPSSRLVGSPSAPRSSSRAVRTARVKAPAGSPTLTGGPPRRRERPAGRCPGRRRRSWSGSGGPARPRPGPDGRTASARPSTPPAGPPAPPSPGPAAPGSPPRTPRARGRQGRRRAVPAPRSPGRAPRPTAPLPPGRSSPAAAAPAPLPVVPYPTPAPLPVVPRPTPPGACHRDPPLPGPPVGERSPTR